MKTETNEIYEGRNAALRHALHVYNITLSEVKDAYDVGDDENPLKYVVTDDPAIIHEHVIMWRQLEAQRNGVPATDLLAT